MTELSDNWYLVWQCFGSALVYGNKIRNNIRFNKACCKGSVLTMIQLPHSNLLIYSQGKHKQNLTSWMRKLKVQATPLRLITVWQTDGSSIMWYVMYPLHRLQIQWVFPNVSLRHWGTTLEKEYATTKVMFQDNLIIIFQVFPPANWKNSNLPKVGDL